MKMNLGAFENEIKTLQNLNMKALTIKGKPCYY